MAVHGPGRFLGELGLLTGQAAFFTRRRTRAGRGARRAGGASARADHPPGRRLRRSAPARLLPRRDMLIGLGAGLRIIGSRFSPDTGVCASSSHATGCRIAGSSSSRTPPRRRCCASSASPRRKRPSSSGAASSCATRRTPSSPAPSASQAGRRRARSAISWSWAPARPVSRRRSTARPRASRR